MHECHMSNVVLKKNFNQKQPCFLLLCVDPSSFSNHGHVKYFRINAIIGSF
jgi:hypothetical protein